MDTDRLPEEKKRGMTTDLGFAHFEGRDSASIGLIDVPGHERFIRNMVAGASGIDGAVLVIAADDGWMEQTGRHIEVLRGLGIPVLAIALSKIDLVSPEGLARLPAELAARLRGIVAGGKRRQAEEALFEDPDWPRVFPVDAPRGRGIEELRAGLLAALASLPPSPPAPAWLSVDRAFLRKGAGLVVTGSLRGGSLELDGELLLLPQGERLRIKGLQSYGRELARAEPGSRVAISLSKVKAEIRRGDRLVAQGSDCGAFTSFYLRLETERGGWKPRPGAELELAAGTAHREARFWPTRIPGFLRVAVDEALPLLPGEPLLVLRKGGAEILGSGQFLLGGGKESEERRRIEESLRRLLGLEALDTGIESASLLLELAREGVARVEGMARPRRLELAGAWAFVPERYAQARSLILEAAAEEGGYPEAGLAGRLGLPQGALRDLLEGLLAEGLLGREAGRIGRLDIPASELSASMASLHKELEARFPEGIDVEAEPWKTRRRELEQLCKRGLASSLDGRLYLGAAAYAELGRRILGDKLPGSHFPLLEAKEATGLSRKWIIPLLNRMERDGLVKRQGELRLVLSPPPAPHGLAGSSPNFTR